MEKFDGYSGQYWYDNAKMWRNFSLWMVALILVGMVVLIIDGAQNEKKERAYKLEIETANNRTLLLTDHLSRCH